MKYKNTIFAITIYLLTSFLFAGGGHTHHKHKMIEANNPHTTLNVEINEDMKSGYNLVIHTTHFEFSPMTVNQENHGDQGHAHIFINGEKYRQYSPYFHLSSKLLQDGVNEIKVTLNANDHSDLMVNGVPLAQTVRLVNKKHEKSMSHKH